MSTSIEKGAHTTLIFNTLAFTVCFACWMINGVLVTFLVDNQLFPWGAVEIGWLMGIPVLTGALFRLPAGLLTDKYGGRPVFGALLVLCAIPMYLLSWADSFWAFALCSFGFGLAGISFSIGIAFTSYWYPKKWQGRALGIFGAGNAGAALTTLLAPSLLNMLTNHGSYLEGWRYLPQIYAAVLLLMGILFFTCIKNKKAPSKDKSIRSSLAPLKSLRVWRFGLYYFLVFGMFVSYAQWLVPYFVNVYYLPLVMAGLLASLFSFPSGVIRALGGWMSDRWGPRKVMYWVLGSSLIFTLLLSIPKMQITTPGKGIMSRSAGIVTQVSTDKVVVGDQEYILDVEPTEPLVEEGEFHLFPVRSSWQTPVVKVGQEVQKKELIARGTTHIIYQANVWVFVLLVILVGSIWGVGKAAVYKYIPDYFPGQVGVVGGMVGLLGGLGGFFGPIIFGYLLEYTGLWTSSWMFMLILSGVCLLWMNKIVHGMMKQQFPKLIREIESTDLKKELELKQA